jgi:hypothetical protein
MIKKKYNNEWGWRSLQHDNNHLSEKDNHSISEENCEYIYKLNDIERVCKRD